MSERINGAFARPPESGTRQDDPQCQSTMSVKMQGCQRDDGEIDGGRPDTVNHRLSKIQVYELPLARA